jgi:hypothetical protein
LTLAPSRPSNKTLITTPIKQNGNIRQQPNYQKTSVSFKSNDSSYSPTTMDEKNNNLTTKQKLTKTSTINKERRSSMDLDEINDNIKKERPIGKN